MDDNPTPGAARHRPAATAVSSGVSAPLPGPLRRSFTAASTMDDARRARVSTQASHSPFAAEASSSPGEAPLRRSSNFSEYSLSEARDLLNPKPTISSPIDQHAATDSSSLASLSLAFALLPALAGAIFKDGNAVVTDVMLLGLAGVFLHWSVTQPWAWYYSAQELRIHSRESMDIAIEDDSDVDSAATAPAHHSLDNVPEDQTTQPGADEKDEENRPTTQQESAQAELYMYEILALMACFILPLMGAYLLHTIRSQLSRPSEGLVSNYNLTIFLLVSELRVFSHMIKLVQSRTLHLQRIVQGEPVDFRTTHNAEQLETVLTRLERLESRLAAEEKNPTTQTAKVELVKASRENAIARDVRNAIQPELDALNRAVRRYEKKATLLQFQTESRFVNIDARLDDAIALAASAAKNSASHKNVFVWVIESLTALVLLPFKTLLKILLLPLSTLLALANKNKKNGSSSKMSRSTRSGKTGMQARYNGDRVPARVSKR